MKKLITTLMLCAACTFHLQAQYVTIPDPNFVAWLNSNGYAGCMSGNLMDTTCPAITNTFNLQCYSANISDITGVSYFNNLTTLNCTDNHLSSLPALPNNLITLSCTHNQLTSLSGLPGSLKFLYCNGNFLTGLPSLPSGLLSLICNGNLLTGLPSLPNSITSLWCGGNPFTSLPALPSGLIALSCYNHKLTSLPSLPGTLTELYCDIGLLTSLPALPAGLTELYCSYNPIGSLPALPGTLTTLRCDSNLLSTLPPLPAGLTELQCRRNVLTGIPVLPTGLIQLYCSYNQLTSLPLLPGGLIYLQCDYNQLTSLPVLPDSLVELGCSHNQLTNIPVLPNSVVYLGCGFNQLTGLPPLPDSLSICYINNNPITCMPLLHRIVHFDFSNTLITCSPNFGNITFPYPTQPFTLPRCEPGNAAGCLVDTPCISFMVDSVVITPVSCLGGADGAACVYLSGGTPPYTYVFSSYPFDTSANFCHSNLPWYSNSTLISDAAGCKRIQPFMIEAEPPFAVQITSATGGALPDTLTIVPLGGTPPFTFFWYSVNNDTSQSIIVDSSTGGLLYAFAIDSTQCRYGFDSILVTCSSACVWPGDADHNYVVDNNDLLAIGLAYGASGPSRPYYDIDWYPYASLDWPDTLSTGTNYKHIDCDGDGYIDAYDTTAILQNFGLTHAKTDETGGWRMTDPTLHVQLYPDTTRAGDTLYANILLGDTNVMASNVYGLAFTLHYDASVVDSAKTTIAFGNSWVGNDTDKISIAKDFKLSGQLKCALTRIDHTTRSGFGQIGQAQFVITADNILANYQNNVWLSDIKMIDNLGNVISVNAGRDSSVVEVEITGTHQIRNPQSAIRVSPNPANDEVQITVTDELVGGEMKLLDVQGRILTSKTISTLNFELRTLNFSQGIYFIQVTTENGTLTKRLVIAR